MALEHQRKQLDRLRRHHPQPPLREAPQIRRSYGDHIRAAELETRELIGGRPAHFDLNQIKESPAAPIILMRAQEQATALGPIGTKGPGSDEVTPCPANPDGTSDVCKLPRQVGQLAIRLDDDSVIGGRNLP